MSAANGQGFDVPWAVGEIQCFPRSPRGGAQNILDLVHLWRCFAYWLLQPLAFLWQPRRFFFFFFAAGSASVAARAAPPSASVPASVGVVAPSCSFPAHAARFMPLRGASVVVAHLRPSSACAAAPPANSCSGSRDAFFACRGLASGVGGSDTGVAGVSSMSLSDDVIALLAPASVLAS